MPEPLHDLDLTRKEKIREIFTRVINRRRKELSTPGEGPLSVAADEIIGTIRREIQGFNVDARREEVGRYLLLRFGDDRTCVLVAKAVGGQFTTKTTTHDLALYAAEQELRKHLTLVKGLSDTAGLSEAGKNVAQALEKMFGALSNGKGRDIRAKLAQKFQGQPVAIALIRRINGHGWDLPL